MIPTANQYKPKEDSHSPKFLDEILNMKLNPFNAQAYEALEDKMVSNLKMFQKYFYQPKADLFQKVMITHSTTHKRTRYFFSGLDLPINYLSALKKFVNQLYSHYGPDDRGREEFNNRDKNEILKSGLLWSGRIWKKNLCGYEIVVEAHTTEWVSLLVVVHP